MIEVVYRDRTNQWVVLMHGIEQRSFATKRSAESIAREVAKRRGYRLRIERQNGTHQRTTDYAFTTGI